MSRKSNSAKLGLVLVATLLLAAQCGEASLTISPAPVYDFGEKLPGSMTPTTFTVTNTGDADAVLGAVDSAALGLAAPFSVVGGTCVTGGTVYKNNGRCTLQIAFAPDAVATFSDSIDLQYTNIDTASPVKVSSRTISGTGSASNNCFDTGCLPDYVCGDHSADIADGGACVLIPPPPPNCMAPCLFELTRKCMPTLGLCYSDPTVFGSDSFLRCDPQTHWAERAYRNYTVAYYKLLREREVCYERRLHWQYGVSDFWDGANFVARADPPDASGTRRVACAPNWTEYYEERPSPECSDWMSKYMRTRCRSVTDGSCAEYKTL